jgi:hypothetical protein
MDASIAWLVITAVLSGGLGWLLYYLFEKQPRVLAFYGHTSSFTLNVEERDEPLQINTHSVVIRNVGKRTAHNVRLGHTYFPDYSIYPVIPYEVNRLHNGQMEIVFPRLVSGRIITITYAYPAQWTFDYINTYVESEEGGAQIVPVELTRTYPRWIMRIITTFTLLGVGFSLFHLIRLAIWLIKNIP